MGESEPEEPKIDLRPLEVRERELQELQKSILSKAKKPPIEPTGIGKIQDTRKRGGHSPDIHHGN